MAQTPLDPPAPPAKEPYPIERPRPARRLEKKIALVTGGGTGIGRAVSLLFAREGASVIVAGRRSEPLQETVREIRATGGVATFTRGDVSKADRVELIVQGAIYNFGGLDLLVNSAGVFQEGNVVDTTERRWDKILGANLKGAYMVSRQAIPAMKSRGGGVIVNIASVHGLVAVKSAAAYCASKGGLIALTRAMALDHADDRIRVNAICPGVVDSPMTSGGGVMQRVREDLTRYPLARPGTPDDVARLALFLSSEDSAWMTGSVLGLDGGFLAG